MKRMKKIKKAYILTYPKALMDALKLKFEWMHEKKFIEMLK